MKWATSEDLGVIAFATKKAARARHPSCRFLRCEFSFYRLGWIAIDPYGTENGGTLKTPDGREIPVVSGHTAEHGRLIGMRGANVSPRFSEHWRAIMARVIEAGLTLHEYKRAGNG